MKIVYDLKKLEELLIDDKDTINLLKKLNEESIKEQIKINILNIEKELIYYEEKIGLLYKIYNKPISKKFGYQIDKENSIKKLESFKKINELLDKCMI